MKNKSILTKEIKYLTNITTLTLIAITLEISALLYFHNGYNYGKWVFICLCFEVTGVLLFSKPDKLKIIDFTYVLIFGPLFISLIEYLLNRFILT